jgi:hypothetical protein
MTAPTAWGPDEWIDDWAPVDRLHQMPILAAQARELGQTRNPDGDRRAQRSHSAGSRPAARLDLIDVADDTTEARGELRALILWCSRPIWEGVDDETRQAHPQPLGTPTWETECAWLAGIWQTSRAQLDEVELDMTYRQLDKAYGALCRAVGLRPPQRYRCDCGAILDPVGEGEEPDYYQCHDCGKTFNQRLLIQEHLRKESEKRAKEEANHLTATQLAKALKKTPEAVWQWASRGIIAPIGKRRGRPIYDLEEVKSRCKKLAS